jgi:hypothetical protein
MLYGQSHRSWHNHDGNHWKHLHLRLVPLGRTSLVAPPICTPAVLLVISLGFDASKKIAATNACSIYPQDTYFRLLGHCTKNQKSIGTRPSKITRDPYVPFYELAMSKLCFVRSCFYVFVMPRPARLI